MTKFVVIDELDGWLPREVAKHGSHNQKTHGRGGGAREVSAKDVDSAWDAVLSDEARTIDNPKKAHPEKYDSKGKLKDGEVETRRVQGEGPPRVRDYETNESAGLSWSEAAKVEGALGLSQTGDFTMRVPIGPERPPQHVYRVMSTEEFDQARQRGYIKSDERMNLASGEGTVTSLRSTGDFYAPVDGSDYRVVRIKYDDADGWRTDTIDSYIKTQERVPFDRVDLYSSPLTNPRVVKHGSHNQASHNPHKGGAKDLPEGWSPRSKEALAAQYSKQAEEDWGYDSTRAAAVGALRAERVDVYDGPNGSQIIVEKAVVSDGDVATLARNVSDMQAMAPNPGMTVTVGNRPFIEERADPDVVYGFARLGKPEIALAPRAVGDGIRVAEVSHVMPSAASDPKRYALAHEWGHTIDQRSGDKAFRDNIVMEQSEYRNSMSPYGMSDGRSREAFAEAFAHYTITGGDVSRPSVAYFAETYNWSTEGGIPVAKAIDIEDVFIIETFTPEGPIVREYVERDPFAAYVDEIAKAVYVAFEPGLRPVLKHGSHDQSSHGRRGGGGSSLTLDAGVAQSIVERVRANGGLSVSMVDGSEPTEGFMVAKGGKQSAIVDADEFYDPVKGPEAMSSFLKENRELSEGAYLGLWHNQADGKVYLDVSENIMDRATAIAAGRERDQISIWDVANFEEIDTGGTGAVGKAVAGSETAGPVQDDRRGDRRVRKESVGEGGGAVVVFEPGLRPVLKHGSHDQSSHGRRGGGGGKRYAPAGTGLTRDVEAQQDAMARALMNNDFSGLDIGSSRLAMRIGNAEAAVIKRIESIAARVGIKRKQRWKYTADEASSLRDSYYERYGKPSWMGKAFKIIRKHLGGAHDQKAHGRGKGGGESGWGERQKEIDAMASAGPPAVDLDAALSPIDEDDVRARIAEDYAEDIESDAREYVEERMAEDGWVDNSDDPDYEEPLIGKTYQEEFDERMAQERENYIDSYVDNYGPEYRDAMRGDLALDEESFNEVYGTSHTGITNDGREVTLTAQVESVYADSDWGDAYIQVNGTVYDADGNWAGEFERKFFRDEYGDVVVEHALLNIDPEYQGTGFSQVFNRTAENYYISHGIDKIDIHAALDVGGYAWAKQGFDWAPKGGATSNVKRRFDDVLRDSSLPASVFNSGTSLRARLDLPSYDPDYPTPREVASWGYVQGASTWPGKQTLLGSDWYGQKSLTPSGPRLSTTQQEAAATVAEVPGQMEIPGVVS